jgi:hypothetical protein
MTREMEIQLQIVQNHLRSAYNILRLNNDRHAFEINTVIRSIESDLWWDETTERPVRQSTSSGAM